MGDERLLEEIGLTEAEADRLGDEYESDAWDAAAFGKPRRGRPSLANEEVRPYTVRFPVSLMAYVDERARESGVSRSEELRRMVATERDRATA